MSDFAQLHPRLPLRPLLLVGLVLLIGAGFFLLRRSGKEAPPPMLHPERYQEIVSAFYEGNAALIVDDTNHAERSLKRATELAPEEPAAWANLCLNYVRTMQLDKATTCLKKAQELAPQSGEIEALWGHLEQQQGHIPEALTHFRKAVQLDPKNLFTHYALSQVIQSQQDPNADSDFQQEMEAILKEQPDNLKALFELARIAVKRRDNAAFQRVLQELKTLSASWPPDPQVQSRLQAAASASDLNSASANLMGIQYLIVQSLAFQKSLRALTPDRQAVGVPIEHFLKLTSPSPTPAAPDLTLTFPEEAIPTGNADKPDLALYRVLTPEIDAYISQIFHLNPVPAVPGSLLLADAKHLRILTGSKAITLPFPGGATATPPSPHAVLTVDLQYNLRMGLVLAGEGGLQIYHQKQHGTFQNVTARTGLASALLTTPYYGVWTTDIDLDGDLDLVLGLKAGGTVVLRNNGDGTFTPLKTFEQVQGLRDFAWTDVDGDGVPDVALLDAHGHVHVLINERAGHFRERPLPSLGKTVALAAGDVNGDLRLDFVLLQADGRIVRLSDKGDSEGWESEEIACWQGFSAPAMGTARLYIADLDNNGGLDLVASTLQAGKIWLCDAKGTLQPLAASPGSRITDVADKNGDGRFDLLALKPEVHAVWRINKGTKNYQWLEVHPRAAPLPRERGVIDMRINTFAIGSVAEMRSALLVQKQVITQPTLHFGLGENRKVDYARIVWTNGTVVTDFDLRSSTKVTISQRILW